MNLNAFLGVLRIPLVGIASTPVESDPRSQSEAES